MAYNDRNIVNSRSWSNGSLLLTSVTQDDEGFYMCEANNGVGNGLSDIIKLKVHCEYHMWLKLLVIYVVNTFAFEHLLLEKK